MRLATGFGISVVIDRSNLRACLWAIIYCLLIVRRVRAMIEQEISYFVVVPVGLFRVSPAGKPALRDLVSIRRPPARD